jgi:hypothetical protein
MSDPRIPRYSSAIALLLFGRTFSLWNTQHKIAKVTMVTLSLLCKQPLNYGSGGENGEANGYSLHTQEPYAFTRNSLQNIQGKFIDFTSVLYSGEWDTRRDHTFLTYFYFSSELPSSNCSPSNYLRHSYRQFQNLHTSNSIL